MKIIYSKRFKKQFKKLQGGEKIKFERMVNLFINNISDQALHIHALHGKLSHYKSFNVTGDLRVLYEQINEETALFADIDTHSNLYSGG